MATYNDQALNRTVLTADEDDETEFTYTFWTPSNITSSEIKVLIDGVASTAFTVNLTTKVVTLDTGVVEDTEVEIYRDLNTVLDAGFTATTTISGPILTRLLSRITGFIQDLIYKLERFTVNWSLRIGQNDDFTLVLNSYNSFTIDKVVHQSGSGTLDFTVKKNGSALTDLEDISVTTTSATISPSSTITINPGDKLTITTADNDDAVDVDVCFKCTKTR